MSIYSQSPLFSEELSLSISDGVNQVEGTSLFDNSNTLIVYHNIEQSSTSVNIRLIFLAQGESITPIPSDAQGGIYLFPNRYYTLPFTTGQSRPGGSRVVFVINNSTASTGTIYVSQVMESNGG